MAKERNWTLREDRADYFKIVPEPVLTVNLAISRSARGDERLGKFRLNLRDLAARGFVNHREDGQFTVQINHVNGQHFNLGTRAGVSTPLAPFRVT